MSEKPEDRGSTGGKGVGKGRGQRAQEEGKNIFGGRDGIRLG